MSDQSVIRTSNVRADPDRDLSWQTYLLNWAPQSGREYEVAHAAFIASWAAARAITSETGATQGHHGHVAGCMCSRCRSARLVEYVNAQKASE